MRKSAYSLKGITGALPAPDTEGTEVPLCPVFGECGGCSYQHLSYERELELKAAGLRDVLGKELDLKDSVFEPVIASPRAYHSRTRLDLTFLKIRSGETFLGFMPPGKKRLLPIESCAIAHERISDFLPELYRQATEKIPDNYRTANIVVKTGDDGRVFWGGIGRRSLCMQEKDYFWTDVGGKRIFFSLETFFQANHSILPAVVEKMKALAGLDKETVFLDLYAGVGLFGICFYESVDRVIMVEDCHGSVKLARYNLDYHRMDKAEMVNGRVETELEGILSNAAGRKITALIDPPRRGLSREVADALRAAKSVRNLLYLSCHPESLARDLKLFVESGWSIDRVVPMDFFPKTSHLETLVLLKP